jgi:hypothetical protein
MSRSELSYQPARRAARITSGLLGAAIGLGLIASVVEGMGSRSGGQSLGQFVATQRAIAAQPMAQVTTPAAQASAAPATSRDAV